jgi:drug/metabolite transporter (DMT)-like permease
MQAALTAACVIGYGASLYVNGLSGRALSPAAGLVILGAVRGLFQVALCGAMVATRTAPPAFLPGGAGATLSWRLLVPAAVGVWANAGFMPYSALVEGGEVSVLAPMCAMYSLVPITFGLLVMQESRGWRKLLGIALSLASVLLLAFSGSGFAGSAAPRVVAEKALLFVLVIASWGGGDCAAAYMGRWGSLSTFEIAMSNSVGQFATAAIFGLCAIATGTFSGGSGGGGSSSSNSGGGGVGALSFVASSVVANVLGIIAWLSFTRLGETEGASDFTPIVALYVYVPVLLSGVLLGESFAQPLKIAGLACAGAASVLLSIK